MNILERSSDKISGYVYTVQYLGYIREKFLLDIRICVHCTLYSTLDILERSSDWISGYVYTVQYLGYIREKF